MKPIHEKGREDLRKPEDLKSEKERDVTTEEQTKDDNKTVVLDISKESFTERPHGRTHEPLGPGHEPGTV